MLSKSWEALRVISVRRAFALVYVGAAHVLDVEGKQWDFCAWRDRDVQLCEFGTHDTGLTTKRCQDRSSSRFILRTIRYEIEIPHTIILQRKSRQPPKRVQRFSRTNVYVRDGYQCQYCGGVYGVEELNLDHVVPRSQGGVVSWENIVCSCKSCNRKKGGRTPKQAGMVLLKKPISPRWTPFSGVSSSQFRPEWGVFAGQYFLDERRARLAG